MRATSTPGPRTSSTRSKSLSWLGASDLLCLPSDSEGCPNVVKEALACGRPVVATTVGGIPEIFGAGSPVTARPDPGELAARMADALADPAAFAAHMPDAAELRNRFGADVMAAEIEKAYFAALGR